MAAIETFVHIEPNLLPQDLVSIEGEIPEGIAIGKVELKALPSHWRDIGSDSLHRLGTIGFATRKLRRCWFPPQPSAASGMCS